MKRELVAGAVVILLLVLGVWYVVLHPAPAKAPADGATTSSALVLPSQGPYADHAQYYDIAANYPTSTPLRTEASAAADENATALMRDWIAVTIAQFKSDGQYDSLTAEDARMRGFDAGRKNSLQIMYLIASSEHTVSYIYTVNADTGGAHGNTYFKTFVFDRITGDELFLGDLFRARTDYLTTLSDMSRSKLPTVIGQYYDATFIKDGTEPKEDNFANFFFDGADFTLLFPPYQVAAYAQGPITLRIPSIQLKDILKTQYP
jgi:hypothetical protein